MSFIDVAGCFLLPGIDPRHDPKQICHAQNSPFHMPLTAWSVCRTCSPPVWWRQASHSLAFSDRCSSTVADCWCLPVLDAVVPKHMPMFHYIIIVHSHKVACRALDIVVPFHPGYDGLLKIGHSGYIQGNFPQLPHGTQSNDDAHVV